MDKLDLNKLSDNMQAGARAGERLRDVLTNQDTLLKPVTELSYDQLRAAYRLHRDRLLEISARMREIEEQVPKHYINGNYSKVKGVIECASPHPKE